MMRPGPDGAARSATPHDDRGSALLLFPASVVVVIMLAVICVDFSIVYLAQREAVDAAAQAANDAASAALDVDAFFAGDGSAVRLDPSRIGPAAQASVSQRDYSHLDGLQVIGTALEDEGTAVRVEVSATARTIFAPAVLPAWSSRTVTGSSTVTAVEMID